MQFKKSFIPSKKSKEELKEEIKLKKNWRDPGKGNSEFNPLIIIKPKVLNEWQQQRVNMPERTYERYPVSKAIKNFRPGREFGYDKTIKNTTEQYKKYLAEHKEKFKEYVERPSKFSNPPKFLPEIFLDKKPFAIKKSTFSEFTFPKHNTFMYENKFRIKNK